MRIGLHIAFTTLTAALGGLFVSGASWTAYGDFQQATAESARRKQMLRDFQHLEEITGVLESHAERAFDASPFADERARDGYLQPFSEVLDLLGGHVRGLNEADLEGEEWNTLAEMRHRQEMIRVRADQLLGVEDPQRETALIADLLRSCRESRIQIEAALPRISGLVAGYSADLARQQAQLQNRVQTYLSAYVLAVLCLWLWSSRRLVVPLGRLSGAARRAREEGGTIRCEESGLVEVHELSQSIEGFAAEIEGARRTLEQKVEARTEELDRANRAKSEFLAHMSHELRTPMGAILGFSELMVSDELEPERSREYLANIHSNAQHLLSLLNDVLDLSKIEAGQMTTELLGFDPAELCRQVVRLLSERASERAIDLNLEIAEDVPERVISDPTRVRQILINLVGNAIKFTDQGEVRVRVDYRVDGTEPGLVLQVRDTGIGIEQEKLEAIFDAFAQADNSTTRRFGGTGLGLAISRQLARLLDGDLTVESHVGDGSCFTLTVRAPADRRGEKPTPSEGTQPAPDTPRFEGSVLVVDDVPLNRKLLDIQLTKLGLVVEQAENGREANDRILELEREGRPFDLVLMDMQMPVLDGYGAVLELRRAKYAGAVLALTAHAMAGDRERCLEAGCDGYLTKPVERHALLQALRLHLSAEEFTRRLGDAG